MASAFIGLSVKVLLTNGTSLKGHVADVDPITQRLMLQDVMVQLVHDNTIKVMSSFSVPGGDIKDLQVLPNQSPVNSLSYGSASPSRPSIMPSTTTTKHGGTMGPSAMPLPAHLQPSATSISVTSSGSRSFHDPAIVAAGSSSLPYHDPAIISYKSSASPTKPQPPPNGPEALAKEMGATKTSKAHHQSRDNLNVAESSATESVSRGPRRARRATHNNNHANSNNYNSNNNLSDYGSPGPTHKTVTGKRSSRRYKEVVHEWAQGDTDDFKDEDFDFQHNLGLFDKAAVFAEIREADETAPESLLVNLNRNPNRARAMEESLMLRKLRPTENVLDPAPKPPTYRGVNSKGSAHGSGQSEEDEVDDSDDDDSWNSSSVDESSTMTKAMGAAAATPGLKIRSNGGATGATTLGLPSSSAKGNGDGCSSNGGGGGKKRTVRIQTLSGVACPAVTSLQMQEVERLSAMEMGLSEEQMIENGGRGAAMMCLQALGGSRRIQPNNHNSAPLVVILAGNNRTGAYALCAARHLSNHGCVALAFVAGSNLGGQLLPLVASQSRSFLSAGGELIHTIAELPQASSPVDLIMDGMLGYQLTVRDIVDSDERETVCDLMDWANDNKAPVLSLDMPSGVNGTTGQGDKTKFCVRPKWTLCLGAPKAGCRSRSTTGELFLTDLGIPRTCWKKAGVKGWGMPWGADFLVGLEYL
ncbi:YjeF N-terminal domain-containing protein [Gamsiella multidivaricata]|uniref:YjeF N-terminal domain-containing protein n=1 Tax=Gamsiella multidivaricata TaxID=101098 RepID=UPI002220FCAF|nr:YjeF N-terminal domain-containing protein [Gamsiella multidivaricata]KAG0364593.1 enhancer of mRNA decapping [Gamsiella multidivaricata]KAI7816793.1 YjeF N-terminal domain-containing protein [Gamsiella multidivaricata]